MSTRKTGLIVAVGLAILLVAVGTYLWLASPAQQATSVAEAFLTAVYNGDSARYQAMTAASKQATTSHMQDYEDIYMPLMTPRGLEAFFAGGYAVSVDQYASESQAVFAVKGVTLTPDTGTKEIAQYQYRVELVVTTPEGEQFIYPEGRITESISGGNRLVDFFKPYDRPLLAGLG